MRGEHHRYASISDSYPPMLVGYMRLSQNTDLQRGALLAAGLRAISPRQFVPDAQLLTGPSGFTRTKRRSVIGEQPANAYTQAGVPRYGIAQKLHGAPEHTAAG
jgi:hypothetical protein